MRQVFGLLDNYYDIKVFIYTQNIIKYSGEMNKCLFCYKHYIE